jgi:antitoxin (DNA-binding transcriptional repressor) of toxin-antitoxin stability system
MRYATVSELQRQATRIIADIEATGEEVVIMKKGRPVALLRALGKDELQLVPAKEGGKRHGAKGSK